MVNKSEVREYLSEVNRVNQASTFVSEVFDARCFVAHESHQVADFLRPENLRLMSETISNGKYTGAENPLNNDVDLSWVGRPEGIDGDKKDITEAKMAGEYGVFRKADIDLMVKFRQDALKEIEQIDLSEFTRRWRNVESMPCKVNAFRLLNGEPFGRRRVKSKAPRESIALVLPLSASACVKADVLAAAMAVIVAITEALSDAGFNLEVWIANRGNGVYSGDYSNGFYAYKLKNTSDPFNDALMGSGSSTWFFRTGIFTMMRALGPTDHRMGLGYPDVDYTDEQKAEVLRMIGLDRGHVMKGWPAGDISARNAMKHMVAEMTEALAHYTDGSEAGGEY